MCEWAVTDSLQISKLSILGAELSSDNDNIRIESQ